MAPRVVRSPAPIAFKVHVGLLLEPEVRRAIAAATSAMPVETAPDAVAVAIAFCARVVEATCREGTFVLERMSRCGGHANALHALLLQLRA